MHHMINFHRGCSGISMEQLFSFTCPNLSQVFEQQIRGPLLRNEENTNGSGRKSGGRAQEILSFVRHKSGCWRTSVPDERKPRRDQRRSLSQKRKEQGFRVVEMSETPFDDPSHAENEEKYKKNIWEI